MNKKNTKDIILDCALELFSVYGYEATSVLQIAEMVGIRKASLYGHFESKKAILDEIVYRILSNYEEHSLFVNYNWDELNNILNNKNLIVDKTVEMVKEQIKYVLHNDKIYKARKMLVIEQFQNPELAQLLTKQNYTDLIKFFSEFIKILISNGILKNGDVEVIASQLCLPVSVWLNLCDRFPEREENIMDLIERHIKQFFSMYLK